MVDWIKVVGPGLLQQILIAMVAALVTGQVMIVRIDERVINMERTATRFEQTANAAHVVYESRLRACEIASADLSARMNIVCDRGRR